MYYTARMVLASKLKGARQRGLPVPSVPLRQAQEAASSRLATLTKPLQKDVNECFLVHGTKPEHVVEILSTGLNERFSGGLFGHGVYLAEDPGKCDQYTVEDNGNVELAAALYGAGGQQNGMCYMFVCRALLGWPAFTKDGKDLVSGGPVWAAGATDRELSKVPGTQFEHTSLVAELGTRIIRYREFVLTHGDRVHPDFLLAYERV